MRFPHGETVVLHRPQSSTDTYGNTQPDWSLEPEKIECSGVGVEPRPSGEPFENARNAVTSGFTLYGVEEIVRPIDRFEVRGTVYNVMGQPADWVNPFTGWAPGSVIQTEGTSG